MGNRTFRRHRLHFWPEGVLQGLQGFFLQINIAEIVIHKTDQPDAVIHFFDADGLSGERHGEVDLLVVQVDLMYRKNKNPFCQENSERLNCL